MYNYYIFNSLHIYAKFLIKNQVDSNENDRSVRFLLPICRYVSRFCLVFARNLLSDQ